MKRLLPVLMGVALLLLSSTEGWSLPRCADTAAKSIQETRGWDNCFGLLHIEKWKFKGWTYIGEFKNDKFNGQGTGTFPNGGKYSALSLILGWCLRTWKIRVNPLHQVRRPSGTSRPEKAVEVGSEGDDFEDGGTVSVIQHGELKVLLAYLRGKSLYFPTLLAVSTGLRRGEVLGLKWGDMDLENGTLMVRRAVEQTRKYGLRLKVPKKHSRRQIALPKTVVGEIRRHRREQLELRMKLGMGKGDFVFSTWDGQLRSPGEPVTSVSRRLGHKNPAITLQVYSHVLEGMDDAAAGKTDQIMNAILYG